MSRSRTHPIRPSRRARRYPSLRAANGGAVLIRRASRDDTRDIDRLAELDERALPQGERLVGVLDGRVVAALDVASGTAIADPFVPTQGVVELLGLRAAQVRR
jgi:hypothetical protein